jgi:hypothetical protein
MVEAQDRAAQKREKKQCDKGSDAGHRYLPQSMHFHLSQALHNSPPQWMQRLCQNQINLPQECWFFIMTPGEIPACWLCLGDWR